MLDDDCMSCAVIQSSIFFVLFCFLDSLKVFPYRQNAHVITLDKVLILLIVCNNEYIRSDFLAILMPRIILGYAECELAIILANVNRRNITHQIQRFAFACILIWHFVVPNKVFTIAGWFSIAQRRSIVTLLVKEVTSCIFGTEI